MEAVFEYILKKEDITYEIVGIKNKDEIDQITSLDIPTEYCGKAVTSIGHFAFFKLENLASINIPKSITDINHNAFVNLPALEKITVSHENPKYKSVDNCLIECESRTLILGCENSILPTDGSVMHIAEHAFCACKGLNYNEYDNALYIGDAKKPYYALMKSKNTEITSCRVNENTVILYDMAFAYCKDLKNITIPKSVKTIGKDVFSLCGSIESIVVEGDNTRYKGIDNCLIDTENQTLILGCKNSIIPSDGSVTTIGRLAFAGSEIGSIMPQNSEQHNNVSPVLTIPDSVTKICDRAFSRCRKLTNVILPDSITYIDDAAFYICPELISAILPDSITYAGYGMFSECSKLTNVYISKNIACIEGIFFVNCVSLTDITIPSGVLKICGAAFDGCENLKNITFENPEKWYVYSEFEATGERAIDVSMPETVELLKHFKIEYILYRKTEAVLKYRLKQDGTYEVNGIENKEAKENITEITIPQEYNGKPVTGIGFFAFKGLKMLKNITIPDSITEIGGDVFIGCYNLEFNEYDNAVYLGNSKNPYHALISAKDESITTCKINENTRVIACDAFNSCGALTEITIPNSVESICLTAFYRCINLKTITLPDSITSIGDFAFMECENLESITLPSGITVIECSTFDGCKNLTNVTLPKDLKGIGQQAFEGCTALKNITITKEVKNIGPLVFKDCTSLTSVSFENPNGWYASEYGDGETPLNLTDPTTAAQYLKDTYKEYNWYRK